VPVTFGVEARLGAVDIGGKSESGHESRGQESVATTVTPKFTPTIAEFPGHPSSGRVLSRHIDAQR
jgi:hypothetical protein